jgi:hypothetical protein
MSESRLEDSIIGDENLQDSQHVRDHGATLRTDQTMHSRSERVDGRKEIVAVKRYSCCPSNCRFGMACTD